MTARAHAGALTAALILGCGAQSPLGATQIVVTVDSDFPSGELGAVRVDVRDPRDDRLASSRRYELAGGGPLAFPFSFAVDRGQRDDVRIVVVGLDPRDGSPRVEHKADARFVAREARLLRVQLARACNGVVCDAQSTCAGDALGAPRCAPITLEPLTVLVPGQENAWPSVDGPGAVDVPDPRDGATPDASGGGPDGGASSPAPARDAEVGTEDGGKPDASPLPTSNLLRNPSFEETDDAGNPVAWQRVSWHASPEYCADAAVGGEDLAPSCWMAQSTDSASQGTHSASIAIPGSDLNDARWLQLVTGLVPGRSYALCGKIRGSPGSVYPGANLFYEELYGALGFVWNLMEEAPEWPAEPACGTFTARRAEVEVGCRIGAYGAPSYGEIWCDELSLRELP